MNEKILIVEDQWIEASDLQLILESAGFTVTGIAKSVDQAQQLLNDSKPDMVLLDIFLKGDQTGIDFAKILSIKRIPFIYLTANSDAVTLEAAKATQPYGFLVKPYRERDILVALDIAAYRYKNQLEIISRQERLLGSMLQNIAASSEDLQSKLIQLAKAFEAFVPLCCMLIDLNTKQDNMSGTWLLERSAEEEYTITSGWDILENVAINSKEYVKFKKFTLSDPQVKTDGIFRDNAGVSGAFLDRLKQRHGILSSLHIPLLYGKDSVAFVSFFSKKENRFNNDHIEFASSASAILGEVIKSISADKCRPFNWFQNDLS